MLRRVFFGLFAATLAACAPTEEEAASTTAASTETLATRPLSAEPSRVIYQVLVRSFWDGWWWGDGTGDFAGVVAKLDYLADLGVDTLLLMPVHPSTGGMGYVPTDLFGLDPGYGHEEDFRAMVDAAHARGFRVLIDTPLNHIADSSAWFQRARHKDCAGGSSASPYCRYFYFARSPGSTAPYSSWHKPWDWDHTTSADVFHRPWGFDASRDRDEPYYATFSPQMPDLAYWDFDRERFNEPLLDDIRRFFEKWSALGVDGYRIDAAKHLVEGPSSNVPPSTSHNLELLRHLLRTARSYRAGSSFIAEVYSGTEEIESYLPDASDLALDFPYMYAIREGLDAWGDHADAVRRALQRYEATQDRLGRGHRVVFAGNHDVPRLWTVFRGDLDKIRMAHFLALLAPEPVSMLYGEEVGMAGDVVRANPRANPPILEDKVDTVRAFPWDGASPAVGFPSGTWPVMQAPDNYRENNLAAMKDDPGSLFSFVKNILAVRRSFPLAPETRVVVSTSLYGSMTGYTLVNRADTGPARCRTVVVNMSNGGPWTIPVAHAAPECGAPRETFVHGAWRTTGGYAVGPYGKIVVD
ncbi:MAG: alpha-amylase family glycosyl hydrolase [Labilithrix sp.]